MINIGFLKAIFNERSLLFEPNIYENIFKKSKEINPLNIRLDAYCIQVVSDTNNNKFITIISLNFIRYY